MKINVSGYDLVEDKSISIDVEYLREETQQKGRRVISLDIDGKTFLVFVNDLSAAINAIIVHAQLVDEEVEGLRTELI